MEKSFQEKLKEVVETKGPEVAKKWGEELRKNRAELKQKKKSGKGGL